MDKDLGLLIRGARNEVGLSQDELGALLGIKKQQVSLIEEGKRRLYAEELLMLALIFQDWFEFRSESFMEGITADLAARLHSFLKTAQFKPEQVRKKDWFYRLGCRLDNVYEPTIT